MKDVATRTHISVIALAIGFACTSCVPKIANIAKDDTVPEMIATLVPREAEILVLPLWLDSRQWNFRDPYIIPTSAIGTPDADVPRRISFYFDDFVCGGPSKFVVGYLVVSEAGAVIWTDVRGENQSTNRTVLKRELTSLVSGQELGPNLRALMEYDTADIGFRADEDDLQATVRFLARIPNEQ